MSFPRFHGFRLLLVINLAVLLGMLALPARAQFAPSQPGASADGVFEGRRGGSATEGSAVFNVDTGLTYPSIQDAINAATAGQTLEVVAPSLLEGQVLVDRDLTLRGATGTEVVRMAVDTGNAGDNRAWFLVAAGVDLLVRDLTFDGNGFLVHQAFRHRGTGSFEDCVFRDIRYNDAGPDYAGTAVVAFGGRVDVRRSSFETFGRVGVLAFGTGVVGAQLEDNVFTGKGDGNFLDYGIEVGAGAGAELRRNRFTDCRGVAASDGSRSAGVLVSTFFAPGTTALVEENDFLDNDRGLQIGSGLDTSSVVAAFNRFSGNAFGMGSTAPGVLAENNWWCCNGGPIDEPCDVLKGPEPIDVDPWLVLSLSADPTIVPPGETSQITAGLTFNSDGLDTSGLGHVPDGIPVTFAATAGAVTPPATATLAGLAEAVFSGGAAAGPVSVSATLDCETVAAEIDLLPGGVAIPTLDPLSLGILAAVLLVAGWWLQRRRRHRP